MSFRAPAAGVQVGRGHVRVDARRALAKLREYQLANPVDWVLEGIRAGVASRASELFVDGDANDVWLAWQGPTWSLDDIPELLSELVSPASSNPSRRLLARAVNSALGAKAEFVDVFALSPEAMHRFRFTPESFAEAGATVSKVATTGAPGPTPETGMLIHVRRRLGLDVLRNALRGEPPELERVRQACWSHEVPIRIRNTALPEPESRHLLQVELGRGLSGYLALCHPQWCSDAMGVPMSLAEHGVVLERRQVDLFPDTSEMVGGHQPLAVYVNADRLPSNASRSKVREDTHPMTTAMVALGPALQALLNSLCDRLEESPEQPELRRVALSLLARYAGGPDWSARLWALPDPLQRLASLPLVRNAMGIRRPVRSRWQTQCPHLGRSPYPEEFSPWMSDIPWIPKDDPANQLYGDSEPRGDHFKILAKRARRGLKRQRSFLKQSPQRPILEDTSDFILWGEMGTLCADSTALPFRNQLAQIAGQVGLVAKGTRGVVHIRVDGREIEEFDAWSAVPFTAVVEFPELVPRPDYRAVERNQAFDILYRALSLQLVGHVECLLIAKEGELSEGIQVNSRRLTRADAMRWTGWALSSLAKANLSPVAGSPLARQPHFVDIEGRLHSLDDLRTHPMVAITSADKPKSRPAHLLIRGSLQGLDDLATLVGPQTELVFYPPEALRNPASNKASLRAQMKADSRAIAMIEPETLLECKGRPVAGAIAWTTSSISRLHIQHLSMNLVDQPLENLPTPSEILVRADFLRPLFLSPEKTDLEGLDALAYSQWHDELFWASCRLLVRCAQGEDDARVQDDLGLAVRGGLDRVADRVLLASKHVVVRQNDGQLIPEFANAPIVATTVGRRSVAELTESNIETFHYLLPGSAESSEAQNLAWEALVLSTEMATAVAALLSRPVVEGEEELARRTTARDFERRRAEHQKNPQVTAEGVFDSAASRSAVPSIVFSCLGAAVQAWPGRRTDTLSITVVIEGRLLCELVEVFPLPMEVVVTAELNNLDSHFALGKAYLQQLRDTIEDHAEDLVVEACRDKRALGNSLPVQQFLQAFVILHSDNSVLIDLMRRGILFDTVRGEARSIEDCSRAGQLMTGRHTGLWLEGESPHELVDTPNMRISESGDAEMRALLDVLAPPPSDNTEVIFAVQAKRRVLQGLVERPNLEGRDVGATRDLEDVSVRNLGVGKIGLCGDGCKPFLLLYSEGELQSELGSWSRVPVAIAIDNPALRRHILERGTLARSWRQPLEEAGIEYLRGIEDVVEARLLGSADTPLESSMRQLLLVGHEFSSKIYELPLFPRLHGPKMSWSELRELGEETIWYVSRRVEQHPLDEDRFVLLLDEEEIPAYPRLHLHEATEDLRKDEAVRANRSQAPVRDLELPAAIVREAMARSTGTGLQGPLSDIAVLCDPNLRGIDVIHEGRLLCTLPDPCPWPTVAVASASRFRLQVNRTHDGVEPGVELEALQKVVREKSRRLLRDHFPPPEDRLVSSLYLAAVNSKGFISELEPSSKRFSDGIRIVAGRLWLSGAPQAHGFLVTEENTSTRRVPRPIVKGSPILLPIEGVLQLANSSESLSQTEIDAIALVGYRKLVHTMSASWSETSRDDRHEAHVKIALSLGLLAPSHVKAPSLAHQGERISPEAYASLDVQPDIFDGLLDAGAPALGSAQVEELVREVQVGDLRPEPPEEEEAPLPAETGLVSWLRIQLHELHLSPYFTRLTLEDNQGELVTFDQGWLRLGGASPLIHELSELVESEQTKPLPLFDLLLHVASVLEGGAPMFTEAMHEACIGKILVQVAGGGELALLPS